jgi:DNA-binding LacI/PurR family transcriptional regulator
MLRERGYTSIAFLGGPQISTSTEDRLLGLRDSLAIVRIEPCAVVYGHSYCHEAGFTLMKQLLRNGGIDAVFCGDDVLAVGAIGAGREAGIDVPRLYNCKPIERGTLRRMPVSVPQIVSDGLRSSAKN